MSKVTTPIEQDGYNAYGYVDGKRVPVLSTSMGNCWDQDDQRAFCGHIVHCANNHDRLVEALRPFAIFACSPDGECDCNNCTARALLAELETKQ